ncbi:MAG TPA: aldo/keto reductase [Opitutaceae bacterium]|nr:aldo/keto reductase [Opitutaceae bacterium]
MGSASPSLNYKALALGTVQLGMTYGIANSSGQPSSAVAAMMVGEAWRHGVRYFDTAQDYGASEQVLGLALDRCGGRGEARVISKLSVKAALGSDLANDVAASLQRLGVARLWSVMMHREEALDGDLPTRLMKVQAAGHVEHVGVSVYSPARALQSLRMPSITALQVAANVFDRRMKRAGVFDLAQQMGKHVFVRSVYLQGLATMSAIAAPAGIPHAAEAIAALVRFCAESGVDRRRFAMDHVRWMAPAATLVIGAESVAQVIENCDLLAAGPLEDTLHREWEQRWSDDHAGLIDPRQWRLDA